MIYVFKTTVNTRRQAGKLRLQLNKLLKAAKWNFDHDDCDRILRVDMINGTAAVTSSVIDLLQINGFDCEELED